MRFFDQLNSDEKHRKSLKDGAAMNTNKDSATDIEKQKLHLIVKTTKSRSEQDKAIKRLCEIRASEI